MTRYDLLLRNGRIVDGSGAAAYVGEVAVKDGKIAEIGQLDGAEAEREIDVGGRVVAPGFIDIHSHCDFILPLPDQADFLEPFVRQGITTLVVGNCGYAPAPINPDTAPLMQAYTAFIKPRDLEWGWQTFGEYLDYLEDHGVFMNTVPLAAHGALRIAVMGFDARAPNHMELGQMKRHLQECMDSGAHGLSCGLIYAPGMFASTDELAALADVLPAYDGIFTFHVRGSSETLIPAAQEVVEVARQTGVRVQHSHLEAFGKDHWPKIEETLLLHERARHQNTTADERLMRHAPGRITGCRSHQSWSWRATIARATKTRASTSTSRTRKMSANEAAPNDRLFRYGKAMSMRLTVFRY